MIFRRISLIFSKYIAIALCVIALLLATPWGSRLTLFLFNNIDGVTFDYHSGTIVRGVKLNSFHLQLDTLDIIINGLSTEFDSTCVLKNTLCIKSAKADYFALRYINNDKEHISINKNTINQRLNNLLFEMPFAIEADLVELKESSLLINNTEISIKQLVTQLSINKSEFDFSQPAVKQLTLTLESSDNKSPVTRKQIASTVNNTFTQLPEINLPISLNIMPMHLAQVDFTGA